MRTQAIAEMRFQRLEEQSGALATPASPSPPRQQTLSCFFLLSFQVLMGKRSDDRGDCGHHRRNISNCHTTVHYSCSLLLQAPGTGFILLHNMSFLNYFLLHFCAWDREELLCYKHALSVFLGIWGRPVHLARILHGQKPD